MTETKTAPTADDLWQDASAQFSNLRGMRPRRSWFSALSVGASRNRLQKLKNSKDAETLLPKLAALSDGEFSVFRSYSQVNLEQAEAAVRLSLIANVTIPVGLLVIANQFFPGIIQGVVKETGVEAMLGGFLSAALVLFVLIWYCYAGVFQARNLDHLTTIAAARRLGADGTGTTRRGNRGPNEPDAPTEAIEQLL